MKDLRLLLPLFLLILIIFIFTGCGGVIPSPGTTDDFTTISGQIKMPLDCCTILPEEANSISKTAETCDESDLWSVTPGAIVELKSAEKGKCNKVLDTTIADETGNYVFEDVKPGLYIITAYCPVEDDKGFLTKDVAEKLSGQALDAGIPDCTSTALALVIEKINDCYDEHYQCFNKYSEAYKMVKGIAQDIGTVDISAIISHDDFGSYCDEEGDDLVDVICAWPCCIGPGTTGGGGNITPTPTYNLKMAVEPEGSGIATDKTGKSPYRKNTEVNILAAPNEGWKFTGWTVADDTKSLSRAPAGSFTDASKANTTFTMPANDVIVTANFVGQCAGNTAPVITVPDNAKVDPNPTEPYTWTVTATDTDGILGTLTFSLVSVLPDPTNNFTIDATTGVVSWDPTCEDIGDGNTTYTITVSVSDGCAPDQGSFKITLLAEQCENYTVTFDKNHEDASGYTEADPKTKSVLYGSNVGTLPTAPTRTGYTFINWNTQPGGGGTEFTATTAVTDDITVYAQWEDILTYNVTYDGNGNTGGTAPEDSTDYQEDDEVTVLGPSDLVKTGYTFSHWNTKSDGTGETFYQGDTFDMPGNDVTLYARWKADIFDDFEPLTIA
ncbi:MAG: InlB B-repeat-containing protein, partial [Atribacterota bacterium]|nr:InlB B-repeat-containing protein [Atribacterota bacterium]